ncbi:MAG: phage tail family protein [Peptostreptococcaceae bacterium]
MFTNIQILNTVNNSNILLETNIKDTGIVLTHFKDNQLSGEFNKVKGINQNGSTLNSALLGERDIDVEGVIVANNREQIEVIKRMMILTLNPLNDVIITYSDGIVNKEITGRASFVPRFSSDYKLNNNYLLGFNLSFDCFNPYWRDTEDTVINIGTWISNFEFPFELEYQGIEFATKGPNEIEFINYGEIESPLEIIFLGPALNPKIILNDKEFIKVNKTILDQETLYISTSYGNKKVEIVKSNGVVENAYNYIDIFSNFFKLPIGLNKITYSTDEGHIPQSVLIKYKNQYLSL